MRSMSSRHSRRNSAKTDGEEQEHDQQEEQEPNDEQPEQSTMEGNRQRETVINWTGARRQFFLTKPRVVVFVPISFLLLRTYA